MELLDFWPLFAFLSAILWTCVSLFDKFSVRSIFTSPSQGMLVSGLFSIAGFVFFPFVSWSEVTQNVIYAAFAAGFFIQMGQLAYFYAIYEEDVGDLTALASMYPLIVALISIFFGEDLNKIQWLGVLLVVSSLLVIRGVRQIGPNSAKNMLLIICYVLSLAMSAIIVSNFLDGVRFHNQFPFYCLGLVIGSFLPFFPKKQRKFAIDSFKSILKNFTKFGFIEIINLAALGCEVFALGRGHPAIVTAISSTEPAFAFVSSDFLSRNKSLPAGCFHKVDRLLVKVFAVLVLAIGLGLLA